jgi:outer membrane protein assembly factor BamA
MNLMFLMKYILICILLNIIFTSGTLLASEPDTLNVGEIESIRIDSIRLSGNNVTQDFIILRELTFKKGDVVNGKILQYNKERIFSLQLFNKVEFFIIHENDMNILLISVKESWYIYPLPFVRSREGDIHKTTFGVNLNYKNFRGRDETLQAAAAVGYDPYYSIAYQNPALFFENDIGLTASASYSKVFNNSENALLITGTDFQYTMFVSEFTLSKRLDQFNLISVSFGYNYIESPYSGIYGISASGLNIDRFILFGGSYQLDTRDLKQYSENGLYSSIEYYHKGFLENNISYNLLQLDLRSYHTLIENLSAKVRVAYRGTFGDVVPFYDYSILDYNGFLVRGHRNEHPEAHNMIVTSAEISYPILSEWDFSIKLPLLPERLTSARIGIYISGFYDAGTAYNNESPVALNSFLSGYGLGISFLVLPYYGLRFEYALNERGSGEFSIGSGVSF